MRAVSRDADVAIERKDVRSRLDAESDFIVLESNVTFRQSFQTIESIDTYFRTPPEIIDATRGILTSDNIRSIAKIVRDKVFFTIGCNKIPLFVNTSGGRGRTLEFRRVFRGCSAFLDTRLFSGVNKIKWIAMGISHSRSLSVFPQRMPRNTFPEDTLDEIRKMATAKVKTA